MDILTRLVENPSSALLSLVAAVWGFNQVLAMYRRRADHDETAHEKRHDALDADLKSVAASLTQLSSQHLSLSKDFGIVDQKQNQFQGKVEGLQVFWRGEFDKVRDEFRAELRELREDFNNHRQIVHDRLDRAQSALLEQQNEFFLKLEESFSKRS